MHLISCQRSQIKESSNVAISCQQLVQLELPREGVNKDLTLTSVTHFPIWSNLMENLVPHFSLNLKGRLTTSFFFLIKSKFGLINSVGDLLLKSSLKTETEKFSEIGLGQREAFLNSEE